MKRRGFVLVVSVILILVLATSEVHAQRCCINPLVLPFAVAGAVLGTAAAITSSVVPGPVYPAYCAPYRHPGCYRPYYTRHDWIPGHYNRYGHWVPGHWR